MDLASVFLIAIKFSLFMTVMSYGLAATPDDALYLFRRPGKLIRVLFSMNVIMPLFVGILIAIFNFQLIVELALVALSVSPVPPILPNKAFKSGGQKAFTFGLLAAVSLLSIVIIPLALNIFAAAFNREAHFSEWAIIKTILTSVILPFALGMLVRHFAPDFSERVAGSLGKIAMVILVIAFLPILAGLLPSIWTLIGNGAIIAAVVFAVAGVAAGHFLGAPDPHEQSVLALATVSRHPAISVALMSANVDDTNAKAAFGAIILYILVSGIVAAPYLVWMDKKETEKTRGTAAGFGDGRKLDEKRK